MPAAAPWSWRRVAVDAVEPDGSVVQHVGAGDSRFLGAWHGRLRIPPPGIGHEQWRREAAVFGGRGAASAPHPGQAQYVANFVSQEGFANERRGRVALIQFVQSDSVGGDGVTY